MVWKIAKKEMILAGAWTVIGDTMNPRQFMFS